LKTWRSSTDRDHCRLQWLCRKSQSQTSSGSASGRWHFCHSDESAHNAIPASRPATAQVAMKQSIWTGKHKS